MKTEKEANAGKGFRDRACIFAHLILREFHLSPDSICWAYYTIDTQENK